MSRGRFDRQYSSSIQPRTSWFKFAFTICLHVIEYWCSSACVIFFDRSHAFLDTFGGRLRRPNPPGFVRTACPLVQKKKSQRDICEDAQVFASRTEKEESRVPCVQRRISAGQSAGTGNWTWKMPCPKTNVSFLAALVTVSKWLDGEHAHEIWSFHLVVTSSVWISNGC